MYVKSPSFNPQSRQFTNLKAFKSGDHNGPTAHPIIHYIGHKLFPLAATITLLITPSSPGIFLNANAAIPIIPATAADQAEQQRLALEELGLRIRTRQPEPNATQKAQDAIRTHIREAMALIKTAQTLEADGDFTSALSSYKNVVDNYSDLALAERARVRKALLLYQIGRTSDALLQLEDEEVALRGSPEVHAALAVVLYAERPNQRERAEDQWELASELDKRFSDVEWVKESKKWPPKMLNGLTRFINLQ